VAVHDPSGPSTQRLLAVPWQVSAQVRQRPSRKAAHQRAAWRISIHSGAANADQDVKRLGVMSCVAEHEAVFCPAVGQLPVCALLAVEEASPAEFSVKCSSDLPGEITDGLSDAATERPLHWKSTVWGMVAPPRQPPAPLPAERHHPQPSLRLRPKPTGDGILVGRWVARHPSLHGKPEPGTDCHDVRRARGTERAGTPFPVLARRPTPGSPYACRARCTASRWARMSVASTPFATPRIGRLFTSRSS
jgi:hypothetical protein